MKLKSVNRSSRDYRNEFLFFWVLYVVFTCFIFSISRDLQLDIVLIISATGLLYAFVNAEIFTRHDFGFYGYQGVGIPILILFVYLQYNILEMAI